MVDQVLKVTKWADIPVPTSVHYLYKLAFCDGEIHSDDKDCDKMNGVWNTIFQSDFHLVRKLGAFLLCDTHGIPFQYRYRTIILTCNNLNPPIWDAGLWGGPRTNSARKGPQYIPCGGPPPPRTGEVKARTAPHRTIIFVSAPHRPAGCGPPRPARCGPARVVL